MHTAIPIPDYLVSDKEKIVKNMLEYRLWKLLYESEDSETHATISERSASEIIAIFQDLKTFELPSDFSLFSYNKIASTVWLLLDVFDKDNELDMSLQRIVQRMINIAEVNEIKGNQISQNLLFWLLGNDDENACDLKTFEVLPNSSNLKDFEPYRVRFQESAMLHSITREWPDSWWPDQLRHKKNETHYFQNEKEAFENDTNTPKNDIDTPKNEIDTAENDAPVSLYREYYTEQFASHITAISKIPVLTYNWDKVYTVIQDDLSETPFRVTKDRKYTHINTSAALLPDMYDLVTALKRDDSTAQEYFLWLDVDRWSSEEIEQLRTLAIQQWKNALERIISFDIRENEDDTDRVWEYAIDNPALFYDKAMNHIQEIVLLALAFDWNKQPLPENANQINYIQRESNQEKLLKLQEIFIYENWKGAIIKAYPDWEASWELKALKIKEMIHGLIYLLVDNDKALKKNLMKWSIALTFLMSWQELPEKYALTNEENDYITGLIEALLIQLNVYKCIIKEEKVLFDSLSGVDSRRLTEDLWEEIVSMHDPHDADQWDENEGYDESYDTSAAFNSFDNLQGIEWVWIPDENTVIIHESMKEGANSNYIQIDPQHCEKILESVDNNNFALLCQTLSKKAFDDSFLAEFWGIYIEKLQWWLFDNERESSPSSIGNRDYYRIVCWDHIHDFFLRKHDPNTTIFYNKETGDMHVAEKGEVLSLPYMSATNPWWLSIDRLAIPEISDAKISACMNVTINLISEDFISYRDDLQRIAKNIKELNQDEDDNTPGSSLENLQYRLNEQASRILKEYFGAFIKVMLIQEYNGESKPSLKHLPDDSLFYSAWSEEIFRKLFVCVQKNYTSMLFDKNIIIRWDSHFQEWFTKLQDTIGAIVSNFVDTVIMDNEFSMNQPTDSMLSLSATLLHGLKNRYPDKYLFEYCKELIEHLGITDRLQVDRETLEL